MRDGAEGVDRWDVVILGGGFAGVACARRLERLWGAEAARRVLLVSAENYFLFYPLLPEVVGAGLAPDHVIHPLRRMVRRCAVRRCDVRRIDLAGRRIELEGPRGMAEPPRWIEAGELVLALGGGVDVRVVPGMMEHGLFLRTLADALELRGRVIRRLEDARAESDPERRRRQLSFVVVGGGFSGVETAGEVLDLLLSVARLYPELDPGELRVTLVQDQDHLLPELGRELGAFTQRALEKRGMRIVLGQRVSAVDESGLWLQNRERIESENVVCTIGGAPHPLLKDLELETERGRVSVDEHYRARASGAALEHVWAAGDCCAGPDGHGGRAAPTAQFASRQGDHVARNLAACLQGRAPAPFRHRVVGMVASIGHKKGVASLRGLRLSGFAAWFAGRTIHLAKLPGLDRKLRVMLEWTLDLFFPRDTNYIDLARTRHVARVSVPEGTVLYGEGDVATTFYVVEEGAVELSRSADPARAQRLGPGDPFGEVALLRGRPQRETARAAGPAVLLAFDTRRASTVLESFALLRQVLADSALRFLPEGDLGSAFPEELLGRPVSELMSRPAVTVPASASVAEAFEVLGSTGRGNLPLVDDGGRLTGLVTRGDLYREVAAGHGLEGPAAAIATRRVATLEPDATVREALAVLRRNRIKHAPVCDADGRPLGMLSYADVGLALAPARRAR